MTNTIAKLIGASAHDFDHNGILNPSLDIDAHFFLDPKLLQSTSIPEFRDSYAKIQKYFTDIIKLIKISKTSKDIAWKTAQRRLQLGEAPWLCIGYSKNGVSGSGIGPDKANSILETISEIVSLGMEDPEIFELIGVFQEGIGADRLSDLLANIILDEIVNYSERMYQQLTKDRSAFKRFMIKDLEFEAAENPSQAIPILLIPRSIVRPLPIALDWSDVDTVCSQNAILRQKVNGDIGTNWKTATQKTPKAVLARTLKENPELYADLLSQYKGKLSEGYDYDIDTEGQIIWIQASEDTVTINPMELSLPINPSDQNILDVVTEICEKFKDLIENNGLNKLLYKDDAMIQPKKEEASQLLFFGIANAYCQSNGLDLSPEVDAGRGPVDFKLSSGYRRKALVEVKLSSNKKLEHGFTTQLQQYKKSEKTDDSIYMIIITQNNDKKIQNLIDLAEEQASQGMKIPKIICIDARRKPSASHI